MKETGRGKALTEMKSTDEYVSHKTHDRQRTNTGCAEEEYNECVDDAAWNGKEKT